MDYIDLRHCAVLAHVELTELGWRDGCLVVSSHHWLTAVAQCWCSAGMALEQHWSREEPKAENKRDYVVLD